MDGKYQDLIRALGRSQGYGRLETTRWSQHNRYRLETICSQMYFDKILMVLQGKQNKYFSITAVIEVHVHKSV